jgi:hypothetical protein
MTARLHKFVRHADVEGHLRLRVDDDRGALRHAPRPLQHAHGPAVRMPAGGAANCGARQDRGRSQASLAAGHHSRARLANSAPRGREDRDLKEHHAGPLRTVFISYSGRDGTTSVATRRISSSAAAPLRRGLVGSTSLRV